MDTAAKVGNIFQTPSNLGSEFTDFKVYSQRFLTDFRIIVFFSVPAIASDSLPTQNILMFSV